MVSILARRIAVPQRLVAVRTIGKLNRLVRGIADGQLARVGIVHDDSIAAAAGGPVSVMWRESDNDGTYSTISRAS